MDEYDLKRKTKAQLALMVLEVETANARLCAENARLCAEVASLREKLPAEERFGYGGAEKEPETEVGYLRRELAYAQGQLHQSHLTVKQLCARRDMPSIAAPSEAERRADALLRRVEKIADRINDVMPGLMRIVADDANARDLEEAGITAKEDR